MDPSDSALVGLLENGDEESASYSLLDDLTDRGFAVVGCGDAYSDVGVLKAYREWLGGSARRAYARDPSGGACGLVELPDKQVHATHALISPRCRHRCAVGRALQPAHGVRLPTRRAACAACRPQRARPRYRASPGDRPSPRTRGRSDRLSHHALRTPFTRCSISGRTKT